MDAGGATTKYHGWLRVCLAAVGIGVLIIAIWPGGHAAAVSGVMNLNLTAGAGAPGASGNVTFGIIDGNVVGRITVRNLPAQPFGSGRFYGLWYVRNDNSKSFFGALVKRESIIFSTGGSGVMRFSATRFTTGPAVGSPITFGPAGTNTLVVLIENALNGLTPSPVGPVPGSGVAVVGTF